MYNFSSFLDSKLNERQMRNSSYSLRSFARDLDISPGVLSKLLNNKFVPSLAMAIKITNKLGLRRIEQKTFIKSVVEASIKDKESENLVEFSEFDIDRYEIVSKWYNYAILELTLTSDFKSDYRWISERLGIDESITSDSIERLLDFGMLKKKNGRLIKSERNITTSNKDITNDGLKEYQKSIFQLAQESTINTPFDKRSMQTMTMAIDPKKIEIARDMIENFLNDMCEFLEADKQEEVYQMSVGLFPLTKEKSNG